MVYRVYVEKKAEYAQEAASLLREAVSFLGLKHLENVRVINRYDAENISEDLFAQSIRTVFSEPQVDDATRSLDAEGGLVFAVEYLPGQYDQRADSAAQCIQIISQTERPLIRSAKVYVLYGALTPEEVAAFKKHVINPVEAREAELALPETLKASYALPETVATLSGFRSMDAEARTAMLRDYGLAMDEADLKFCQDYFSGEDRDPTDRKSVV